MFMRHQTYLCSLAVLLATGSLVCTSARAADAKALPVQAPNWVARGAGANYTSGGTASKPVGTVELKNNATVLNWNSFNIGKDATMQFQMPSTTARVLNNVTGGALTPTQVNGILNANGQVYIYDPRGIVFGKGSQVNVNSLVASSLKVNPDRFMNGILTPSLDPIFASETGLGFIPGAVVVQGDIDGGALQRAAITAQQNGFILLAAPQVQNSGDLKAPDGQVVLAAGTKVYLAAPALASMRGFKVEVSNEGLDAMVANATNTVGGVVDVQRGNATMVGMAVNQMGTVSATTSVNLNGSIYLRAQSGASKTLESGSASATIGGSLTLGPDSRTWVTPALEDASTAAVAPSGQPFKPSEIDLTGNTIVLQGVSLERGASVRAAGAVVTVTAQENPSETAAKPGTSSVQMQAGSAIDVSGSAVQMAMESNVIAAELRGTELADNPLLRNSPLRGQKIYIDSRQALAKAGLNPADLSSLSNVASGTLIADTSGYLKQIERNVGQNTTKGGTVTFTSDGSVSLQSGSTIDVSGGWVDYQTGYVSTTKLTLNGKLYDAQTAPADLPYDGLVRLPNSSANLELGYRQGASAGAVLLTAPQLLLDGALKGSIATGARQRDRNAADAPRGATLSVGTLSLEKALALGQTIYLGEGTKTQIGGGLSLTVNATALAQQGFDTISVLSKGDIEIGSTLTLNPKSALEVTGGSDVRWWSGVIGTGATVTASAVGRMEVADGTTFDLAGRWQNDTGLANPVRDANGALAGTFNTQGGSLTLSANVLQLGSEVSVDVSGGAQLDANNKLYGGKAGSIELKSVAPSINALDASLSFASDLKLKGYGVESGGSMTLSGRNVWIDSDAPGGRGDPLLDLVLAPAFFQQGGFSKYTVGGSGNLTIAANTALAPRADSWLLGSDYALQASGSMAHVAGLTLLPLAGPAGARPATSLTLRAGSSKLENEGVGVMRMEQDASITVDPGANVTLQAIQALDVQGSVRAPGGAISLFLKPGGTTGVRDIAPKIWVGEAATLDTSGTADNLWIDGRGVTQGALRAGGSIVLGKDGTEASLTAAPGAIFIAPGAVLKASGANVAGRQVLDGTQLTAPQTLVSDAGTIAMSSDAALLVAGSLVAEAGGAGARGGTLKISVPFNSGNVAPVLTLGSDAPEALWSVDLAFANKDTGAGYKGRGFVNTPSFDSGGFARTAFQSSQAIVLEPGLELASTGSIRLDTPVLRAGGGSPKATMLISAPSVTLGVADLANQAPRGGSGAANDAKLELAVNADTIDVVGSSATQGFGQVRLLASHDVRMQGVLTASGPTGALSTGERLEIQAARVYPSTLSDFALHTTGTDTRIEIGTSGALAPAGEVLSAGGSLTLTADTIVQGGRLLAPFGQIALEATKSIEYKSGSLTSVAGISTVPFGLVNNGAEWVYGAATFTAGTKPDADAGERSLRVKKISSNAPSVTQADGAVLDIAGGGALYGYGVAPGPGGSSDILSAADTYAINPKFRGLTAPLDAKYGNTGLQVGDQIYLSASAGLPAGYYTLLPAHYALLDGGMAVVATGVSASARDNRLNADGTYTVAGKRISSTDGRGDTRTTAFKLLTGTEVRRRTEFQDFNADTFFTAQAAALGVRTPDLPRDGGQLSFQVSTQLDLAGQTKLQGSGAAGNSGHAGMVDISAPAITVTANESTEASGTVRLLAGQLNALGADSLLLGGRRTLAAAGMQLQVDARSVRVDNDRAHPLQGLELLLVARDSVEVTGRSSMVATGSGTVAQTAVDMRLYGTDAQGEAFGSGSQADGAVLRLSSAGAVNISRDTPLGTTGRLTVGQGALLSGSGSMLLDATQDMSFQPSLNLAPGSSFAARAPGINLGAVAQPDTTPGLTLSNATLAKLNALSELDLASYSFVNSYGNVALGGSATQSLRLQAASFNALDGASLAMAAQTVALSGMAGGSGTADVSEATGKFSLRATNLKVGDGVLGIKGFKSTDITATDSILLTGSAMQLWVDNELQLHSPHISASPGTLARITSGSAMALDAGEGIASAAMGRGLGANLGFYAKSQGLKLSTTIEAQSGQIALSGAYGVAVNAGALVDVSGVSMAFGTGMAYAPAGSILIDAGQGDLTLAGAKKDGNGAVLTKAAQLNLNSTGADAGSLELRAVAVGARVTLKADLLGSAAGGVGSSAAETPLQGSFTLDVGRFSAVPDDGSTEAPFDALNAKLNANGFTQSRSVRVRSGDLGVGNGSTLIARNIALSVDDGNLAVQGTLDASGPRGGTIDLYAASAGSDKTGKLALTGATLTANATVAAIEAAGSLGDGGRVTLGVSNTGSDPTIGGASLNLDAGSTISALGKGLGSGGAVLLRAPVTEDSADRTVAVERQLAKVQAGTFTLEAVKVYTADTVYKGTKLGDTQGNITLGGSSGAAGSFDVAALNKNANNFMLAYKNLASGKQLSNGEASGPTLQVQPGVEVRASGDLTVSVNEQDKKDLRGWDLSAWRFGDDNAKVPGTLTLRAAGNLTVRGSISDGFSRVNDLAMPGWSLRDDDSWSMRLVGGGDLAAAAPLATKAFSISSGTKGNLSLVFARGASEDDIPSAMLRTGTGRIELAAAQNIVLGSTVLRSADPEATTDQTFGANIYTAGKRAQLPDEKNPPKHLEDRQFVKPDGAYFGQEGGAIALRAGGDVVGVASAQTVNSWLFRQGRTETDSLGKTRFFWTGMATNENAKGLNTAWWSRPDYLGTGVATLGGGDITVVALQGSVKDLTASAATNAYLPAKQVETPLAGALVEQGGGDLLVRAGKDIAGGQFYVQKGSMTLQAKGAVVAGNLEALDNLAGVNDPANRAMRPVLALGDASAQVTAGGKVEIETVYNPTLTLQSNKNATVVNFVTASGASSQYSNFLSYGSQSAVGLTSVGGDVLLVGGSKLVLDASLVGLGLYGKSIDVKFAELMALAPPSLSIAALSGNVRNNASFGMAPASRGTLNIYAQKDILFRSDAPLVMIDTDPATLSGVAAPSLLNGSDRDALVGDSVGLAAHTSGGLHTVDTQPVRVVAKQGNISGLGKAAMFIVPKRLEVRAGGDIVDVGFVAQHLGADDVSTVVAGGKLTNSTNSSGKSLVAQVLAGPGLLVLNAQGSIDLGNSAGVVTRGNLDNVYLPLGGAAIEAVAGTALSDADLARTPAKTELQNAALFATISGDYLAAKNDPKTSKEDQLRAFDSAIATQFPTNVLGSGSILSFGSQFKTEQGGAIDLWAPGGSVVAGLISIPDTLKAKDRENASEMGIFTVRGGAIRSLVGQDFIVNKGRVFTIGGGDVSLVSQYGNIDAGKGAKTASSAPPPLLTTDDSGNTKLDIAGSISGSGIATLRTSDTQAPSNVVALAPRGIFDAGDAGVRSTGTVAISAAVVRNSDNISAASGVSGAVSAPAAAPVAAPAADVAASSTKAASGQTAAAQTPSLALTVDVLGYGDVNADDECGADDAECEEADAKGGKKRKARKPKTP
jgi:filamentous hemagglutinin family protein